MLREVAPTKQFKAEVAPAIQLRAPQTKRKLPALPPRTVWPTSTFTLERQPSGIPCDFDLYDERDLPFLDKSTEVGREVSKNVI